MTAVPKYVTVFEALQREILEGKFSDGRRLPSEAELCLRYKVSRPTAARALRDLQQMGVITRRAGSGSYPVLLHAPAPAKLHVLGLFVPGLGNTEILVPIHPLHPFTWQQCALGRRGKSGAVRRGCP
jgi:LacI family transcriptional regulator